MLHAFLSGKTLSRPNLNFFSIIYRGLVLGVFFVFAHCAFLYAKLAELPTEVPLAAVCGRFVAASLLIVAGYYITDAVASWTKAAESFKQIFVNTATGITTLLVSMVIVCSMLRMI
jgi:uncharacterized membrane protein